MRPREHGQCTHLEPLHLLDVILAILGRRRVWEIDRHPLEKLSLLGSNRVEKTMSMTCISIWVARYSDNRRDADSLGFPGNGYGHLAHHHVHHGEMFQVIVRLEKSVSREEFHKDTPDREHIAREAPSEACQGRRMGSARFGLFKLSGREREEKTYRE